MADVQAAARPLVGTHREPHPANLLLTTGNGRLLLIDWDTVAATPPQRDLWWLAPKALAHYCELAQRDVNPATLELYRLRWRLDDFCIFVNQLRRPRLGSADRKHAWQALQIYLHGTG